MTILDVQDHLIKIELNVDEAYNIYSALKIASIGIEDDIFRL